MSSSDDFFSNELASPPLKQSTSLKSRTSGAVRKGPPPPPPKRAGGSATTPTTTTTRRPSSTRPRTTTAAPSSSSSSASARRSARPLATPSTTTSPPTSSSSSTSTTMRSRTAPSQNRPVGSYYQSGSSTTASAPAAKASTESWDWSPSPAPAPATDFSSWAAPAPTATTTTNTGASDWYSSSTSLSAPVDPSPEATTGGIYTSSGFANPMTSQPQHHQQQEQSSAGFYGSAPAAQPLPTASTSTPAFLSGSMDQQAGAAPAPTIMNPAAFVPSQTDALNQNTTGAFDGEEAPLLEEIGVNIEHITTKSRAVVLPFSRRWGVTIMDPSQIVQDADLAGPIAFALILGAEMVLAGKLQFGAIYGFGVFGCLSMTLIVNLMSPSAEGISVWTVSSVLGYALIPVNLLAAVKLVVINLASLLTLGRILGLLTVAWSTIASTRLLELGCGLREQRYLIAYPIVLLYSAFVMITIF